MQRRLALSYAAIFSITLLLLGPVLYLSFSSQMASAFDKALRLAAQRQAALALIPTGFTVGMSNKPFNTSPSVEQRGTFYLLLSPTGRLRSNPGHVGHAGLPDESAARLAAHLRVGVFSTVATADVGDIRLFTVPILRGHRVVALLQAGTAGFHRRFRHTRQGSDDSSRNLCERGTDACPRTRAFDRRELGRSPRRSISGRHRR